MLSKFDLISWLDRSKVILQAYRNGCIYDAWSETFDYSKWLAAFENTGVDINFYTTRERALDEIFPWDFIDTGVTKEFLKREWENAKNGLITLNCKMACSGCGAMIFNGGVCFEDKN